MRPRSEPSSTASAAACWRSIGMLAALAGAGISTYLLVEYLKGNGGICLTGSGCDLVRQSAFAYPLGIPMPLLGVAFYLVAAWLVWRTLRAAPLLGSAPQVALAAWAAVGLAVSMVLTGLEAFVIHAFCTWCVGQAIASLVLAVAAIGLLMARQTCAADARRESGRERRQHNRSIQEQRSALRRVTLGGGGIVTIAVATLLIAGAVSAGPGSIAPSASGLGTALAPADAPRLGSGGVTVVEFADFQCPGCAAVSPILDQLANEGAITLVYRHFPLPQHPNAVPAARAAEAANSLGRFWPMHDLLFQAQQQWESLDTAQAEAFFRELAGRIGLDQARWQSAYESAADDSRIQADTSAANALRLPGTPSIFINGRRYSGSLSESALRAAVTQS